MSTNSQNIQPEHSFLKGDKRGSAFGFTVEPFCEDYTGRLSWHLLGNHLLRCASLHAGQHGFGYDSMQAHHHAWVLSRLVIELDEMPRTGEHYVIETWVNRIYRQFTDRLFAITNPENGKAYGYAFSTWALIDTTSRQPMDLGDLPNGGFSDLLLDCNVPITGPGRIRLKQTDAPVRTRQAYYTDLDINGHVNSIRYIEMMLDLFPAEKFKEHPAKRIEVAYSAEAYANDKLFFYQEASTKDDSQLIEIRKEDGRIPVVKASFKWQ